MASRVVALLVLLGEVAGCEPVTYPYRGPCPDGGAYCCPPGTYVVSNTEEGLRFTICVRGDPFCPDTGDGGTCEDSDADAP